MPSVYFPAKPSFLFSGRPVSGMPLIFSPVAVQPGYLDPFSKHFKLWDLPPLSCAKASDIKTGGEGVDTGFGEEIVRLVETRRIEAKREG